MVSENYQQGINSPQKCNSCEEKCVNFYLKGAVEPFETFQQGFKLKIVISSKKKKKPYFV